MEKVKARPTTEQTAVELTIRESTLPLKLQNWRAKLRAKAKQEKGYRFYSLYGRVSHLETLREAWGMPNGLPVPAFAVEIGAFLLRTESELVLKSRRVVPGRLLEAGFEFEFSYWADAARDLVRRWKNRD